MTKHNDPEGLHKLELAMFMSRDDLLKSLEPPPEELYHDGLDDCYYKWKDFWKVDKQPVDPLTLEYITRVKQLALF